MKRFKSIIALLRCFLLLTGFTPINSSEKIVYDISNISEQMDELTPYIRVEKNEYVLELPSNIIITPELKQKVDQQLSISNEMIKRNDLVIDLKSKVAKENTPNMYVQPLAYGKNAVYIHWNYLEIYMDAGLVRDITSVGIGVAVGILFTKLPALVAFGAANPYLAIGISVIAAQIISSVINSGIRDGLVLHYNFLTFSITYIGRQ